MAAKLQIIGIVLLVCLIDSIQSRRLRLNGDTDDNENETSDGSDHTDEDNGNIDEDNDNNEDNVDNKDNEDENKHKHRVLDKKAIQELLHQWHSFMTNPIQWLKDELKKYFSSKND